MKKSVVIALLILLTRTVSYSQPASQTWSETFYHQSYFTLGAGMLVSIFPTTPGFYFRYAAPGPDGLNTLRQIPMRGSGSGAGMSGEAGGDFALGGGFKLSARARLMYESVSHTEGDPATATTSATAKNYALSLWYGGLDVLIRKALPVQGFYATGGLAASYYMSDAFSGFYHTPAVDYDIADQHSHYSFNPQQYAVLIGLGAVYSHSRDAERMYSAELVARLPLSQFFYGATESSYEASGVKPSRLWSVYLSMQMELPFGRPLQQVRGEGSGE